MINPKIKKEIWNQVPEYFICCFCRKTKKTGYVVFIKKDKCLFYQDKKGSRCWDYTTTTKN